MLTFLQRIIYRRISKVTRPLTPLPKTTAARKFTFCLLIEPQGNVPLPLKKITASAESSDPLKK